MKLKKETGCRTEIELTVLEKIELWHDYTDNGCIAGCEYKTIYNDQNEIVCYVVFYSDNVHMKKYTGCYKTQAIAYREATKFLSRIHPDF